MLGSAQKKSRQRLALTALRGSGGHEIRTRNSLRSTSFPMKPLTIRLPSLGSWVGVPTSRSCQRAILVAHSSRRPAIRQRSHLVGVQAAVFLDTVGRCKFRRPHMKGWGENFREPAVFFKMFRKFRPKCWRITGVLGKRHATPNFSIHARVEAASAFVLGVRIFERNRDIARSESSRVP